LQTELEELGFGNKNGFCPFCGEFYEEEELDDMLCFGENTDFKCRNCKKWIRGFCEFSTMGSDVEYYLVAIGVVKEDE